MSTGNKCLGKHTKADLAVDLPYLKLSSRKIYLRSVHRHGFCRRLSFDVLASARSFGCPRCEQAYVTHSLTVARQPTHVNLVGLEAGTGFSDFDGVETPNIIYYLS